jgi:4-amino-4-deoxy-L-arabinose transferase-like glycosyltransferase
MNYRCSSHTLAYLLTISIATLTLSGAFIKYIDPLQDAPTNAGEVGRSYEGIAGRQLFGDEAQYLGIAESLATGSGYGWDGHPTAIRVPGYPLYAATLFWLFGATVPIALFGNAILVALLPLLAYGIASSTYGPRPGRIAALFCFLNPGIYYIGLSRAYSEPLFAVLLCTAILSWQKARKYVDLGKPGFSLTHQQPSDLARVTLRPILFACIAGVVYGIGFLTRTGYVGLPILGVIVEAVYSRNLNMVKVAIIVSIVSLLTLIPWGARNRLVLGSAIFSSTNDGLTLLGTVLAAQRGRGDWLNPADVAPQYARVQQIPDGIERNRLATQVALSQLRTIPIHRLLEVAGKRVLRLWIPLNRIVVDQVSTTANAAVNVWYVGFMLLASVGMIKSWRDPRVVPFLTLFLYMTVLAAVAWGGTRFRYGAEPLLAALAGYGFLQARCWFRWRHKDQLPQAIYPQ